MAKFICPCCFREYEKNGVLYACRVCGKVASPGPFESEPIKCRKCGDIASIRKCPKCGKEIPKTALETPNLLLSIAGVANSGKTNYITVMFEELGKASADLGLVLKPQNKETLDHQNENYRRIYQEHIPPNVMPSGSEIPQIWSVSNLQKQAYTFTIFDGAGEDYEDFDASSVMCRYIHVSKAIILTVDPLVLPSIRGGGVVPPDVMKNSLGGDDGSVKKAEDVINNVAANIRTAKGIRSTQNLDIPVAVVLTKFDTLLNHKSFGPNALIKRRSLTIRNGKIVTAEIKQVDEEIRNWLHEINEDGFINTLESHFKEFYFFGISSYGAPPKDNDKLEGIIQPHRVLDPILWIFKRARFID